ncbi:MAG: aconitate hydratase AcnA [Calditrichaeota bacterium]|nr:MAG: aconitate hydratase AcnA [Calditrichota bacterium]
MEKKFKNSFQTFSTFKSGGISYGFYSLSQLEKQGFSQVDRLPFSLKILLENLLRNEDGRFVKAEDIEAVARWQGHNPSGKEIAYNPARILMQDFTGVPAVVDLAAMRDAIKELGGDPKKINPLIPVDLVIDHSIQVDVYGNPLAIKINTDREYERNRERYIFLRWGQKAFKNFRVVPPETGICHQVNLEYLARVVFTTQQNGQTVAFPDTLVGTDSHTTMINGLGVVGWGVGGIEAEAAMLGQPISMLIPDVVGFKFTGQLPEGATATDLVLTVTQMLRQKGVVGKFVEYYGPGLSTLSLADRATIANMSPEYGATIGFFPVDEETLNYLRNTGRDEELVQLVEAYTKEQGLFRTDETPDPIFSDTLELDLSTVEPSIAGPKRPQDRVQLSQAKQSFRQSLLNMIKDSVQLNEQDLERWLEEGGFVDLKNVSASGSKLGELTKTVKVQDNSHVYELSHGSVVIAAITSCTNTSNPWVMLGAGLVAKKAVERGLKPKPWVKTSLAPGSKVVMDYLNEAGLTPYLEKLGFHLVAFGCTTCIGNSGPLPEPITKAIKEGNLVAVAVLSGNRNFEGRINPLTRANYLASPPLVIAYALVGHMDIDLFKEPLGYDKNNHPVFLKDIWPTRQEVQETIQKAVKKEMFKKEYGEVFKGDERWQNLEVPEGDLYAWDPKSTYVKKPPFFENMPVEPPPLKDVENARVLALLGDSVTTDHISPAGAIPVDSPAGRYLIEQGVEPKDFNSFGSRRGNHEVMMRGTFGNIRLKNFLVPDREGNWTLHLPDKKLTSVYEAAMQYKAEGVPLVVIAGKEYGTGSSRDWAAKGTRLLGVEVVIAESFERIHRSNLIGMGVLPLQFKPGENRHSLGLTGFETYTIKGISDNLHPGKELTVIARGEDGTEKTFQVIARVDTPEELAYYQHGGILQYVLRQLL